MASQDPPKKTEGFSTGAVRSVDHDGVRFDLISPKALKRLAATYADGAIRFNDHNWRKGIPYSNIFNHLVNHIYAWMLGEDGPDGNPEDHLAHAAWGLFALMEYEENGRKDLDDRWCQDEMDTRNGSLLREEGE